MQVNKEIKKDGYVVRFSAMDNGKEIGRARLYVIYNDLHKEPYALLEDVFVNEDQRNKGVGKELVQAVIEEARKLGCYKVQATVRSAKVTVCTWYEQFGFKNHGAELRMDLI